jgi:rod shape-determining protein MreC
MAPCALIASDREEMAAIFQQRNARLVVCFVYGMMALLLLYAESRYASVRAIRGYAAMLTRPIVMVVDTPIYWAGQFQENWATLHRLRRDNTALRQKQHDLSFQLAHLLSLQQENASLKALLQRVQPAMGAVKSARLLAIDLGGGIERVVIDVGADQGVYLNQPVLDEGGVFGQVVHVEKEMAQVLLVTDVHYSVPVKNQRSGLRALANGAGHGVGLTLSGWGGDPDVREGDVFITSGLGLTYPVGYPVGRVVALGRDAAGRVANVRLEPLAQPDTSAQLLLVWPHQTGKRAAILNTLHARLPVPGESA